MKSKIVKNKAQQGDVVLVKVSALPDGEAKIISKGRCVLAEGETTGHMHAVEDDEAELIQIGERMLLRLGKVATVTHQEHKPITLSPGIWDVGRVREYSYWDKMTMQVHD
jgi:hypothetical protein